MALLSQHETALYLRIGERVREAREAAKMTQGELGERIGLTRASVTNIEKARQNVQLHTLYAIARALQVPVVALLPEEAAPEEQTIVRLNRAFSKAPGASAEERKFIESLLAPSIAAGQNQGKDQGPTPLKTHPRTLNPAKNKA